MNAYNHNDDNENAIKGGLKIWDFQVGNSIV